MSLTSEDEFSDDSEVLEILNSTGLNKSSTVRRTGQTTLDGERASFIDPRTNKVTIYEEVKEVNISFGATHHELNYDNLDTILYPTNLEVRDYQLDIVKKALFKNILCALPTGLGKTFIASAVMLNLYRWTKNAKIIFVAPTRPLVAQQIKACYGITGIPLNETAILLDRTKRNRKEIWDTKRVLFATPQVVENDLKSGILDPKSIVCVVIDEAHRAKGNYSYCGVIKFIKRFNSSFRVLALTATPGADIESIQSIVDSLEISHIEIRTENDSDIVKYIKNKEIDKLDCPPTEEIITIIHLISEAIKPVLEKANTAGIYDITDPAKINHFMAMEKSQKVVRNPNYPEGIKWNYFFILQLLGTVGQCFRRLNIYGVVSFYKYFLDKYKEFTTKYSLKKSTNKIPTTFYFNPGIKKLIKYVEKLIHDDTMKAAKGLCIEGAFSHTKLQYMVEELTEFFSKSGTKNSSCIIFTEFRESALEIVKVVENSNSNIRNVDILNGYSELLRPHIFIGQAKEKDKFDQEKYEEENRPKGRGKKKKVITVEKQDNRTKNAKSPRPADRIGSSEDAQLKGMNQKLQKELIEKFKSGVYNILVATSIGEEGLDIGEVDLIICFDSTSSPIKNIQRMGRTGRKRDGKILLLFSSNEREKFNKSMENYEWIQKQIKNNSNQIHLHPSDRIVPKDKDPVLEKLFVQIPEENEEVMKEAAVVNDEDFLKLATQSTLNNKKKSKTGYKAKTSTKQKKLEKRFFMPDGVDTGFKTVSSLITKRVTGEDLINQPAKKKSKISYINPGDLKLDEDDDDEEGRELTPSQVFSDSRIKKRNNESISIDLTENPETELSESGNVDTEKILEELDDRNGIISIDLEDSSDDALENINLRQIFNRKLDRAKKNEVYVESSKFSANKNNLMGFQKKSDNGKCKDQDVIILLADDEKSDKNPTSKRTLINPTSISDSQSDDDDLLLTLKSVRDNNSKNVKNFVQRKSVSNPIFSSSSEELSDDEDEILVTNLDELKVRISTKNEMEIDVESKKDIFTSTQTQAENSLRPSIRNSRLISGVKTSKHNNIEDYPVSKKTNFANDKRSVIYQLQHNHKLDPIFKSDFETNDGFMSRDEEIEFYSKYFQNAVYDASRLQAVDDPMICIKNCLSDSKFCRLPHSSISWSLCELHDLINKENGQDFDKLVAQFEKYQDGLGGQVVDENVLKMIVD